MMKNTALLERQGMALFNFWLKKQPKNKRIGDLTIGDFVEICAFLVKTKLEEADCQIYYLHKTRQILKSGRGK
jgi:hypothetical protein